jgi:hypothetical protein
VYREFCAVQQDAHDLVRIAQVEIDALVLRHEGGGKFPLVDARAFETLDAEFFPGFERSAPITMKRDSCGASDSGTATVPAAFATPAKG